jgi:lipopolysaccharide exporter
LAFSFSSRWYKSGAYSLMNRLAIVFFGFWNIYFMVRVLPKTDIGAWTLFLSVTTVLELLRNGFIRNPMITHMVSAPSEVEKNKIITASWVLHFLLTAISSVALLLTAGALSKFWSAPQLEILFYIYVLRGIVLVPCLQFEYLQQAQFNFKAIFWANVARAAPVGIYLTVKFIQVQLMGRGIAPTLYDISIVQLISAIGSLAVGYYFLRGSTIIHSSFDKKSLKILSGFGKYTLGTTISSMFLKSTDTWMIGRMISTIGVASYNPALRISNLIEVPTLAVASLAYPQVNKKLMDRGNEGVQDLYIKSVSIILAMMLPGIIPLYLFSDLIIEIIFGLNYIEAAPILRVTIFFTLLIPFNRQFGTVMDALKRPKVNFYLLVMMATLNVIFNYFFLKKFGTIGAAYGTLLSYIIIFILNQIILHRMYGINTYKVFPAILDWYRTAWKMFRNKSIGNES